MVRYSLYFRSLIFFWYHYKYWWQPVRWYVPGLIYSFEKASNGVFPIVYKQSWQCYIPARSITSKIIFGPDLIFSNWVSVPSSNSSLKWVWLIYSLHLSSLSCWLTIMLFCLSNRLFVVDVCSSYFFYFLCTFNVSFFFCSSSISEHLLLHIFLLISLSILLHSTAFLFFSFRRSSINPKSHPLLFRFISRFGIRYRVLRNGFNLLPVVLCIMYFL